MCTGKRHLTAPFYPPRSSGQQAIEGPKPVPNLFFGTVASVQGLLYSSRVDPMERPSSARFGPGPEATTGVVGKHRERGLSPCRPSTPPKPTRKFCCHTKTAWFSLPYFPTTVLQLT